MAQSQEKVPEFVSVGFIAKRCGVSNTTVLRWIGAGELSAFRLPGGHYRVDVRDFNTFRERYRIPIDTAGTLTKEKNRKTTRGK